MQYQPLPTIFRQVSQQLGKLFLDVCMAIWDVLALIYMPVPLEDKWKSTADEF